GLGDPAQPATGAACQDDDVEDGTGCGRRGLVAHGAPRDAAR
ncbi:hypothetical protein HMPREF0058_1893, partial [Actinomyces urogenitalis DSM 15434]